jgi:U3 small nucleolar RNA-associated protein 6
MAGVADKARFYLERAAPQLRDFEEKQIFSKACRHLLVPSSPELQTKARLTAKPGRDPDSSFQTL